MKQAFFFKRKITMCIVILTTFFMTICCKNTNKKIAINQHINTNNNTQKNKNNSIMIIDIKNVDKNLTNESDADLFNNNDHNNKQSNDDYKKAIAKFQKNGLYKGIVAFGSARIPSDDQHIRDIEEISELCAKRIVQKNKNISFITGGGPSVMEAWSKPAYNHGIQTAGLVIKLPHENKPNKYIHDDFIYTFNAFASRKQAMIDYARAFVVFKGGFGTMDELYEVLNLINDGFIKKVPILIYPADFYKNILNFDNFVASGTITKEEAENIKFCNTKEELLEELYKIIDNT